jgi:hypothetical protein
MSAGVCVGGEAVFPIGRLLLDGEPHSADGFVCAYVALARRSTRVVLLDWDIQSLAQGGVAPWLQHVRDMAISWFQRLKPPRGWPRAHIELAGNTYAIIEAARADADEMDSGKREPDGEAREALWRERVRHSEDADEKRKVATTSNTNAERTLYSPL